jgi:hypothetical protein
MALDWDSASERALAGDIVRPVVLFRLATDPVVRLWSGIGDFAIAADLVEEVEGAVYTGLGELLPTPELNGLVNGLAERVDFQLSGVSPEVAALASTEAPDIRGAAVSIGFLILGDDLQQLSPTAWLWDGEADSLKVSRQSSDGGVSTRAITLSVGSLFTGRKKPDLAYWSDSDQRRRSADDGFCKEVRRYAPGSTKTWPI